MNDTTSALLQSSTALLGNALGAAAQSSANKTNLNIALENNEWAEKMMDKQQKYNLEQWLRETQYNTEMWNKTNEYNTPANQVKRLKSAGLNPALLMGQGQTGNSQSTSAPRGNSVGLPSPSQVQVQAYQPDFTSIAHAFGDLSMKQAQTRRMSAETNWFNTQSSVAAAKGAEEVKDWKLKNEFTELTKDLNLSIRNEDYLNAVQARINNEKQGQLIRQQVVYQQLVNSRLPEKLAQEIAVMTSQVDLNYFNSNINIGKFIDSMKERGIKLSSFQEKLIFAALGAGRLLK